MSPKSNRERFEDIREKLRTENKKQSDAINELEVEITKLIQQIQSREEQIAKLESEVSDLEETAAKNKKWINRGIGGAVVLNAVLGIILAILTIF